MHLQQKRGKSSTFSFPSSPHLASPACDLLQPCPTREGLSLLPPLPREFSVPNPAPATHWHVHFKQIRVQASNYCLKRKSDFQAEISEALGWQCTMLASLTAAQAELWGCSPVRELPLQWLMDAAVARKAHTELSVPSQGTHGVRRCPGVAWPGQGEVLAQGGTSRDILSPPG